MLDGTVDTTYCCTSKHSNRAPLFYEHADYQHYLVQLERYVHRHGVQLHAFVLMTDHVYLLLTSPLKLLVVKMLDELERQYGEYFDMRNRRMHKLLEMDHLMSTVNAERPLIYSRYIELTPVRAGVVLHPAEYPWSSYACNALGEDTGLIVPHRQYLVLGNDAESRRDNYRHLFDEKGSSDHTFYEAVA